MSRSTFANRWNLDLIEATYQRWRRDPASVDEGWRIFFEGYEFGSSHDGAAAVQPTVGADHAQTMKVGRLIAAYRQLGHFQAHLDPLSPPPKPYELLQLSEFELGPVDLDREFQTGNLKGGPPRTTLRELLAILHETYCRTIGVEYMHIQDTRIQRWLEERMEPVRNDPQFDRRKKMRILMKLNGAELFETFLHSRFVGQKRFSLEGAETLIPLLDAIVEKSGGLGVREIVIGMAHRGRLNVLANILGKSYKQIFAEFEGNYLVDAAGGDGDVKYHLGFSSDYHTADGQKVHLSLAPNPSHLEAVDPVVEGRVRAKQRQHHDSERKMGIPLLIHGDAAFAGQGLVAETLNLSQLSGYKTGGTIHVIVNNQIGFTTGPQDARSTTYCTDVAKMIQVPIFHVNGEDPEAVVYVAELALEFRQTFNRDVVIDMYCYRRRGHNEGDEPAFTQPVMYAKIQDRPTVRQIYTERLLERGDLKPAETEALAARFRTKLQNASDEVKMEHTRPARMRGFGAAWTGLTARYSPEPVETGVPADTLLQVARALVRAPSGFTVHPKVERLLEARSKAVEARGAVDWGLGETLAFGSLLLEGTPVRLSGQDSRRGTFSQRHAVLYDMKTGQPYVPLNSIAEGQAGLCVYDSLLSEAAVLGFDYGYSLDEPHMLILWEAQFGDFANGAQVIIDQFVVSGESKWQRASGLVLLLPHGYEGQGPEHSSARLERYLQACAEDNIQVGNLTTPAQYFHILRRQMKRDFRKPLILMTPKSLLRHHRAVSPVEELVAGRFHEVIDDPVEAERIRRVLVCSGKVYYDLVARREATGARHVAIVRLEQFYPFPEEPLRAAIGRYRKAREWAWVQEESQNMGGWTFVEPRLRELFGHPFEYVGRDASASPAAGSLNIHNLEQAELIAAAISDPVPHLVQTAAAPVVGVAEAVGGRR